MVREGELYTVTCAGYASDGAAVARVEGQVVFVKGALRGERCRVFVEHVGHRAAWARVEELLDPSPERRDPPCPHYAQCGGCQLQHMSYAEECAFKQTRVEDALRRVGGLDLPVSRFHAAQTLGGYRNKVQFQVAPGPRLGFYSPRTHRVVPVERCLLQGKPFLRLKDALQGWMEAFSVPAYDESGPSGLIRHLYLRANTAGELLCVVVAAQKRLPHEEALVRALRAAPGCTLAGVVLNHNSARTNVVLGPENRTLWGRDYLEEDLLGLTFRVSPHAFFQVNWAQTQTLYRQVAAFAALTGDETVLDLYCGTGTIGLTLAAQAREVMGADVVPQAIEDARANARRNGVSNARFLCADSARLSGELARAGTPVHLAVVDPPRKGLAPPVVDHLLAIAPQKLIYVSCDPGTLARDLRLLTPAYAPQAAHCVDMFPRTHHVETIVSLARR